MVKKRENLQNLHFFKLALKTPKETVAAIPPGLSQSFARLLHADGLPGRTCHSTSFIAYGYKMYAIWAYLLPCNHHKACRETKWTVRDRATLAISKQISISRLVPNSRQLAELTGYLVRFCRLLLRFFYFVPLPGQIWLYGRFMIAFTVALE